MGKDSLFKSNLVSLLKNTLFLIVIAIVLGFAASFIYPYLTIILIGFMPVFVCLHFIINFLYILFVKTNKQVILSWFISAIIAFILTVPAVTWLDNTIMINDSHVFNYEPYILNPFFYVLTLCPFILYIIYGFVNLLYPYLKEKSFK